jgi:outer membrane protein assembly factor BamB
MHPHLLGLSLLAILSSLSCHAASKTHDWPQWRGPERDGAWRETGLLEEFNEPQLKIIWRADISSGYSGPTVADGRVFVFDRVVKGIEQQERVHCFDARTGDELWTYSYDCPYIDVSYPAGPRSSITVHEGRAYALGTMGNLHCFDAAGGAILWSKDLNTEYKIRMPMWGITCSPLIEKDLVIVQISGADGANLVAFDRKNGEERWKALDDPASYSSPIMIDQAGKRVLVCWTGARLVGLDPASGALYWEHPMPPEKFVRNCASPVWIKDSIVLTSFFGGAAAFRLKPDELGIEKVWQRKGVNEKETDGLHTNFAEPIIQGDFIYGVDSYGQLRCLEIASGKRVWENLEAIPQQRWSTLRFIPNGDRVWMFTELGDLIISRLSPRGYEEISRTHLLQPTQEQLPSRRAGVCWSHPAFAYQHIFARSDEEIVCASLKAR